MFSKATDFRIAFFPPVAPHHLSARWLQLAQMRPEVEEVVPRSVHGSTGTTGDHLTEKSCGVLWLLDDSQEKSAEVIQLYRCIQNNLSSYFVKIQATNIRIPILEYPNFRDKQKKNDSSDL